VDIDYRTACGINTCDAVHVQRVTHYAGGARPRPSLPFDWHILEGVALCPRHPLTPRTITATCPVDAETA